MSDAAAFFAKKKKKKAIKGFNANKIDASTVTQTVHVDAPAMSHEIMEMDYPLIEPSMVGDTSAAAGEAWDDEALAASLTKNAPKASSNNNTKELLDMNSLSLKRREEDDIAERMRLEDTKAQLAAAKAGMEREAARLAAAAAEPKQPSNPSSVPSANKSWIPPHLRGGGAAMTTSTRTGFGTKLDTQSEELFPDLHQADIILEKQQQQQTIKVTAISKTNNIGAATWGGTRPTLQLKKVPKKPPLESKPKEEEGTKEEDKQVVDVLAVETPVVVTLPPPSVIPKEDVPALVEEPSPVVDRTSAEASSAAVSAVPKKKPVIKKKKKDLSTFKPSTS